MFAPGQVIGGRFEVKQALDSSGDTTLYEVHDTSGRQLALRVLKHELAPEQLERWRAEVKTLTQVRHKNLVQVYGQGYDQDARFIVLEHVEGRTLEGYLARRREQDKHLTPQMAYNIVAHICNALIKLHSEGHAHGTLTPATIHLNAQGRVKLGDLASASVLPRLYHAQGRMPDMSAAFAAPEILADPAQIGPAADMYTLAMVTLELLSEAPLGEHAGEARYVGLELASAFHPELSDTLRQALEIDPGDRPTALAALRDALKTAAEEGLYRAQAAPSAPLASPGLAEAVPALSGMTPALQRPEAPDLNVSGFVAALERDAQPAPAPTPPAEDDAAPDPPEAPGAAAEPPAEQESDPFAKADALLRQRRAAPEPEPDDPFAKANAALGRRRPAPEPDDDPFAKAAAALGGGGASSGAARSAAASGEARYLVCRDGFDYGPFTKQEVIDQLHADEIDEGAIILDRKTQDRVPMRSIPAFRKAIQDYIPVREERRRVQTEQREALVATAKTAGKWTVALGVLAALGLAGAFMVFWFFIRPQPEPFDQKMLFADMGAQFAMAPPSRDFKKVSVDNSLLAAIFAEEDPNAPAEAAAGKGRRGKGRRGGAGGAGGAGGVGASVDDSGDGVVDLNAPSRAMLTSEDINATVRRYMSGVRGCMLQEMKRDPNFKGISIQFTVRQSGAVVNARIMEPKYGSGPLSSCLVPRFRTMKFPQHGGLGGQSVTLPFYFQR